MSERCANTEALSRYEREQEKAELALEAEENELYKQISVYVDGINSTMKYFAIDSVMDKQDILEYVRETVTELLEIK